MDGADNLTFNASELQAFRSGTALVDRLTTITGNGYDVSVLAHSMGNTVVGEAFRQWSVAHPGQAVVNTYVAMQGAISAGAYGVRTMGGTYTTDFYGFFPSGPTARRLIPIYSAGRGPRRRTG